MGSINIFKRLVIVMPTFNVIRHVREENQTFCELHRADVETVACA